MMFRIGSWKARPTARPTTPAPASREVTVFSSSKIPRAIKTPRAIITTVMRLETRRLTASLWVKRVIVFSATFFIHLEIKTEATTITIARIKLGITRNADSNHSHSFSISLSYEPDILFHIAYRFTLKIVVLVNLMPICKYLVLFLVPFYAPPSVLGKSIHQNHLPICAHISILDRTS